MKLSEDELQWLRRCEKHEQRWYLTRWFCLFNGAACSALAIFLFEKLTAFRDDQAVAWFAPFVWLLLVMSGTWFGFSFSKWRGDIKMRLLLRLLREHAEAGD